MYGRCTTAPTPSFAAPCTTSCCASATRRIRFHPQTQTLHGSYNAAHATQGPGPPVRCRPLPGFAATGGCGGPPGKLRSTATSRTAPGTVFPWHAARGFCTPRRRSHPHRRSARPQPPSAVQIRPLGLRPRGLGGALSRYHSCTYPSQASTPPPHGITAHAWGLICVPVSQRSTRQAKYMYSALLVFSLFGRVVYASATWS
jgi:hypothetical protein